MALNSLDRLKRSKVDPAPTEPKLLRFAHDPRFDTSLPMAVRKQHVLDYGDWLDPATLLYFGISRDEQSEAWVSNPFRTAQAADWHLSPLAVEPYGSNAHQRYALHILLQGWQPVAEERGDLPEGRRPAIAPPRFKTKQRSWKGRDSTSFEMISYDDSTEEARDKLRVHSVLPSKRRDLGISAADLAVEVERVDRKANVAVVIGPASGHLRVIDADIIDPVLAEAFDRLVIKHLGRTPFRRVGRWPKVQYWYRADPSDEKLMAFTSTSWNVMGPDGQPELDADGKTVNAIEFLGLGRMVTCYGIHHKTGECFQWIGELHPAIAGPEHTPIITAKKLSSLIEDFSATVRQLWSKGGTASNPHGNGNGEAYSFETAPSDSRVYQPKNIKGTWETVDGVVVNGREDYLRYLSYAFAAANPSLLLDDADANAVLVAFIAYAQSTCKDGKSKGSPVERDCRSKWRAVVSKWRASVQSFQDTGKYHSKFTPFRIDPITGLRPCALHIPASARPADGSLDWLPAAESIIPELGARSKINGIIVLEKSRDDIAMDKKCRALVESIADREVIHARVAGQIDAAYDTFLDELLEREQTGASTVEGEGETVPPLHILGGPTGSGKTTRGIKKVGAFCKIQPRRIGKTDFGPIIIAAPTGENIEEAKRTAERSGMTVPNPELSVEEIEAKLKANGVKVVVIRGKAYNKCQRLGEVQALNSRGMSSARLCEARVPKDAPKEALYGSHDAEDAPVTESASEQKKKTKIVMCPFKADNTCEYWKQMKEAETADIILIPHAYLTTKGVPTVIKNARAVFIDESITYRVLHQIRMPLSGLDVPRNPPWLTKAEKDAGVKAEEVHHGFEMARKIAVTAMKAGRCPAADLAADKRGFDYVDAANKTCDRNHRDEKAVRPDLTADEITQLTARETGTNLAEETRFWRIVKERVVALVMDKHEPLPEKRAKGDREMRLQTVHLTIDGNSVPFVRMSWRSEPNWSGAPMMLLDASASPKIMAKVFSRPIVRHDVEAPLHVRTVAMVDSAFANSSFIPRDDASEDAIKICQFNVSKARALITKVAVSYSYGMVLVGMAMAVRQVIFAAGWTPPPNVEPVHFGALRGLDFAKYFVAALSIGRSEQPIHIIDGYQAALTFDDDVPEEPYDKLGTGVDEKGQPIFRVQKTRVVQMRTGEDYGLEVPEMPSVWGKELEEQWREEEQRQFVGRLRPVYRMGDAPTWICMTRCMPEGFVVDDVVALDDCLQDGAVWAMLKRSNGVLAPGLTDQLEWAQKLLGGKDLITWFKDKLPADRAFQSRMMQTLYEVRYVLPNGDRKIGRVAGWHADPKVPFLDLAEAVGVVVTDVEIKPLVKERVAGARRKPDRISNELQVAREALQQAKADEQVRTYVATMHMLLPAEEDITVEDLYACHVAGENIEGRLVGWLHSWHPDRDTVSLDDVRLEWEEAKATKTVDELRVMFGLAECMAAE